MATTLLDTLGVLSNETAELESRQMSSEPPINIKFQLSSAYPRARMCRKFKMVMLSFGVLILYQSITLAFGAFTTATVACVATVAVMIIVTKVFTYIYSKNVWCNNFQIKYKSKWLGIGSNNGNDVCCHAILDIETFNTFNEYVKSLNRSSKCYLKRCENLLTRNNIQVYEKSCQEYKQRYFARMKYFKVILDHQMRKNEIFNVIPQKSETTNELLKNTRYYFLLFKAFYECLIRTFKFLVMVEDGKVIEYWNDKNELIGFCHFIGKGETLRAMWFYLKSDYCHCGIWFHCLKKAIIETINNNHLKYVDLGPSMDEKVAQNKTRFGFVNYKQWKQHCNYNGSYLLF